ncbi:uncharacterized protein LOC114190931 isoform X2 [Vigna unguiculata]|uniref:uncharacterized protein LOC114190931 isoform X2 n=1 Tax=Vigna unguiculata TaxID=3917 RepID=UPI0010165DB4|nr:uncharacterized protein LOC114190931 isoform X2 [Vigna unguiculata]
MCRSQVLNLSDGLSLFVLVASILTKMLFSMNSGFPILPFLLQPPSLLLSPTNILILILIFLPHSPLPLVILLLSLRLPHLHLSLPLPIVLLPFFLLPVSPLFCPIKHSSFANPHWSTDMKSEYEALLHNTLDLVPLRPGRKIVGCKWVFRIKQNPDGSVDDVLVHRSGVNGEHYYAYIRPTLSNQWFKFDDERVTKEDENRALEEQNFECLLCWTLVF